MQVVEAGGNAAQPVEQINGCERIKPPPRQQSAPNVSQGELGENTEYIIPQGYEILKKIQSSQISEIYKCRKPDGEICIVVT